MGADQRGEQQGTRVVRVGLREGQSGTAALLLSQEEAEEQELDLLLMLGKDYCYHPLNSSLCALLLYRRSLQIQPY